MSIKSLIGKKVRLFKADTEGRSTEEVVLEGTYQGVVREAAVHGSFITSVDLALIYETKTKTFVKCKLESVHFV